MQMNILFCNNIKKPSANSGFAKFGRKCLMGTDFCIFGFSPNGKVRGNINPNFAKPRDVNNNFKKSCLCATRTYFRA